MRKCAKYLLMLILVGVMAGQEAPTRELTMFASDIANGGAVIVSAPNCNDVLTFGESTKSLRDIFPEECGQEKTHSQPFPDGFGHTCGSYRCPDLLDASAIEIEVAGSWECFLTLEGCRVTDANGRPVTSSDGILRHDAPETLHYYRHSCADKTRILEHDEQTPPKYWCRKAQTGAASW